jgi:signal transduction histidine kinase
MRTLLLELRPAALEEAEISHLLRQLGESTAGRTRIPVEVKIDGDCNASSEVKIAFYRISQEALNNVAKQSGATHVNVSLICSEAEVKLTISDNGRGFNVEENLQKSLGLGIIQERSKEIGAYLQIISEKGRGTEIQVTWKKLPTH